MTMSPNDDTPAGKDLADLELLFRLLDITRPEQAADIALAICGEYTAACPGATSSCSPPRRTWSGAARTVGTGARYHWIAA